MNFNTWLSNHYVTTGFVGRAEELRMAWNAATKIEREACANSSPKWQPIDTAPKDRSDVWLFCPNDEPQQCVGFFCNGDGGYWEPTEKLVADVVGAIEPTHWMPLPDAPKE